jgi:hypothetical protein
MECRAGHSVSGMARGEPDEPSRVAVGVAVAVVNAWQVE